MGCFETKSPKGLDLPLTVIEAHQLVGATADTARLLQLDELWTAAVVGGPSPEESVNLDEWVVQLEDLVEEMRQLLRTSSNRAITVVRAAREHSAEAENALDSLLWDDVLAPSDRDILRWFTGRHGGFSGMIDQIGTTQQESRALGEIRALDQQLAIIRSGRAVAGDLTKEFRCGSVQQLLVGGILAIPVAGAGGVGTAVISGAIAGAAVASTGGVAAILIIGAALLWAKRYRC